MSAPEILNVDDISSPISKTIVSKGQRHEMREVTVQDFIDETTVVKKRRQDLLKMKQNGASDDEIFTIFFEGMVSNIQSAFPTLGDEVKTWSLPQLMKVTEFISGEINREVGEAIEQNSGNE